MRKNFALGSTWARVLTAVLAVVFAAVFAAGCAPLVVGSAMVSGALVAADRRPVGIQIEDQAIERRIERALAQRFGEGNYNITVLSYNRKVLLTGEVVQQDFVAEAERIAASTENVRSVVNEVEARPLSTRTARGADNLLAAKVRTALTKEPEVPGGAITLTTARGVVYLLGRVTREEGEFAARAVARVDGTQRVVKVFDYLTDEEAAELRRNAQRPEPPPSNNR